MKSLQKTFNLQQSSIDVTAMLACYFRQKVVNIISEFFRIFFVLRKVISSSKVLRFKIGPTAAICAYSGTTFHSQNEHNVFKTEVGSLWPA